MHCWCAHLFVAWDTDEYPADAKLVYCGHGLTPAAAIAAMRPAGEELADLVDRLNGAPVTDFLDALLAEPLAARLPEQRVWPWEQVVPLPEHDWPDDWPSWVELWLDRVGLEGDPA